MKSVQHGVIDSEFQVGVTLARKHKPISNTFQTDRVTIGKRFDGRHKAPVEFAVNLSREFLSRWMGWISQTENLTTEQVGARWNGVESHLLDRPKIWVSFVAFPRADPLEFRSPESAEKESLALDSALVDSKSAAITHLESWQCRETSKLLNRNWFETSPLFTALAPRSYTPTEQPMFELGDYFGSWYLVEAPSIFLKPFVLRLESGSKVRTAVFSLPKKKRQKL